MVVAGGPRITSHDENTKATNNKPHVLLISGLIPTYTLCTAVNQRSRRLMMQLL